MQLNFLIIVYNQFSFVLISSFCYPFGGLVKRPIASLNFCLNSHKARPNQTSATQQLNS